MKKTKILICIGLIFVLLSACKTRKNKDYTKLLQAKWINTMVNEQPILTDETFVMELKPNNIQMYAIGFTLEENNKSWIESSDYTYTIEDDIISIAGTDALDNSMQMDFKVISLDDDNLTFSVSKFLVNGKEAPDNKIYSFKKVNKDFRNDFIGVWYGHNSNDDNLYFYWEYFDDGSFDFYYQDDNNTWVKKANNNGYYFLYGQFMASNYSNDLLTGDIGRTFECWNFNIKEDKMQWTGLRENNITVTFEMNKVSAAPEY